MPEHNELQHSYENPMYTEDAEIEEGPCLIHRASAMYGRSGSGRVNQEPGSALFLSKASITHTDLLAKVTSASTDLQSKS